VTLGILYHMPFWQTPDGTIYEAEGSFARYVDSLAPYFDAIDICAPAFATPPAGGTRVRAGNVRLTPLPFFPGPRQFYPMLPAVYSRLRRWVDGCDAVHLRVPTPAAVFAFRLARSRKRPIFLLVVGDYRALQPHLPYRGVKKALFAAYVAFEERALSYMTRHALTFVNGAALRKKHEHTGARVYETKTTTLQESDIGGRSDSCQSASLRLLTVSRIDPRKGLRELPAAVAALVDSGIDATLDIVGSPIGLIGEEEGRAILAEAARHNVQDRVTLRGAVPLDALMKLYREYDVFVLPTRPGEGIPRVLLEAMANGLPIVTSDVSGIGSLIVNGQNGLLLDDAGAPAIANAVRLLAETPDVRRRIIRQGYDTARAHTLERQAASMLTVVARELALPLRQEPRVA
jgi:glycosyltransferase involved in cell wall biosynthesis